MGKDDFQSENLKNQLQKDFEDKKRMVEFLNLLIFLINEQAVSRYQSIEKYTREPSEGKVFERNINHAFALLEAANGSIKKQGTSAYTDYLITSALSHVAEYLPAASVNNIIHKLDDFTKNNKNQFSTIKSESAEQGSTNKKFNDLISSVSPTFLTKEDALVPAAQMNDDKQIVIDFAADKLPYRKYGVKIAQKLGAGLIQVQPDKFSSVNEKFAISQNMTLTLMGHCFKGSDYLSNNSGQRIYVSDIAKQIHANMTQKGTPLDTAFTIDLIACQAASPSKQRPSFAESLVNELANYGIKNVNVVASPTIMLTTRDGSQANLSAEDDAKRTRQARDSFSIPSHELFGKNTKKVEAKLNEEKVTFRYGSGP